MSAEALFSNWKRSCHFQMGHSAQDLLVEYVFLNYLTILCLNCIYSKRCISFRSSRVGRHKLQEKDVIINRFSLLLHKSSLQFTCYKHLLNRDQQAKLFRQLIQQKSGDFLQQKLHKNRILKNLPTTRSHKLEPDHAEAQCITDSFYVHRSAPTKFRCFSPLTYLRSFISI